MKTMIVVLSLLFGGLTPAQAEQSALRMAVPDALVETGFTRHLLPRFRFRHKITVQPVGPGAPADMALVQGGDDGVTVFTDQSGAHYSLKVRDGNEGAMRFLDWLQSKPGQSAIEGFPRQGPPQFHAYNAPQQVLEEVVPVGDVDSGADLALLHCGRCHVVDDRNRMGGIESTPSFGAMRGRKNWVELFSVFWTEPPHPSFTQFAGKTDGFDASRPSHIVPVVLDGEQVDAIIAYIATIPPKDLGAPLMGMDF